MMTTREFEQGFHKLLRRHPFHPFEIEFEDGSKWLVDQPEMIMYQNGRTAVYFRKDGEFRFVDCDALKAFVELDSPTPS